MRGDHKFEKHVVDLRIEYVCPAGEMLPIGTYPQHVLDQVRRGRLTVRLQPAIAKAFEGTNTSLYGAEVTSLTVVPV